MLFLASLLAAPAHAVDPAECSAYQTVCSGLSCDHTSINGALAVNLAAPYPADPLCLRLLDSGNSYSLLLLEQRVVVAAEVPVTFASPAMAPIRLELGGGAGDPPELWLGPDGAGGRVSIEGGPGPGVSVEGGNAELVEVEFQGTAPVTFGGGLVDVGSGGTVVVHDSNFEGGEAVEGGAVRVAAGGSATLVASTFFDNHADQGGTLFVEGTATLQRCIVEASAGGAIDDGGVVYVAGAAASVTLDGGRYEGASVAGDGGIAFVDEGQLTVVDADLVAGEADKGGAIYAEGDEYTTLDVSYSRLLEPRARVAGAAIYADGLGQVDLLGTALCGTDTSGSGVQLTELEGDALLSHAVVQGGFSPPLVVDDSFMQVEQTSFIELTTDPVTPLGKGGAMVERVLHFAAGASLSKNSTAFGECLLEEPGPAYTDGDGNVYGAVELLHSSPLVDDPDLRAGLPCSAEFRINPVTSAEGTPFSDTPMSIVDDWGLFGTAGDDPSIAFDFARIEALVDDNGMPVSLDWDADADGDGWPLAVDCDDGDADIYPGAGDSCDGNGTDDDCDGVADEDTFQWLQDVDGDGFGDIDTEVDACHPPGPDWIQWTPGDPVDCDDDNGSATVPTPHVEDVDGDGWAASKAWVTVDQCPGEPGWTAAAEVQGGGDCEPNDASIHPGAEEVCDGVDQDCDGADDEGVLSTWYLDGDGDGLLSGMPYAVESCDPPAADPGEDWVEAVDPNEPLDCDDADPTVLGPEPYGVDLDGDGHPAADSDRVDHCPGEEPMGWVPAATPPDCDDGDPDRSPSLAEVCDGVDNDCDEVVDDGLVTTTWVLDGDGDGYVGDAAPTEEACEAPSAAGDGSWLPSGAPGGDCDDVLASVHPGARERCNGIDDDCNGVVDDQPAPEEPGAADAWPDTDFDGYGDASAPAVWMCLDDDGDPPRGYRSNADDCDDTDVYIAPGRREIVGNGIDEDCDGYDGDVWVQGGCRMVPGGVGGAWVLALLAGLMRRRGRSSRGR